MPGGMVETCGGLGPLIFHTGGLVGGVACFISGIVGLGNTSTFEGIIIGIYSIAFGLSIFILEIYQPDWFNERFGFYDTMHGRGFFIMLVGCLALGSTGFQRFCGAIGVTVAILYLLLAVSLKLGILNQNNPTLAAHKIDLMDLPDPLWKGGNGRAKAKKAAETVPQPSPDPEMSPGEYDHRGQNRYDDPAGGDNGLVSANRVENGARVIENNPVPSDASYNVNGVRVTGNQVNAAAGFAARNPKLVSGAINVMSRTPPPPPSSRLR